MSSIKAFLRKNVSEPKEVEYVATTRITEEIDGIEEPVKWILKPINTDKNDELIEICRNPDGSFDQLQYVRYLATYCTVYPPIFSKELQEDWGISNPVELLKAILCVPAEYNNYCLKAQEVCGYVSEKEKMELLKQAKN